MKKYSIENIRNAALVGASGSGKTTFAELMLNNAKVTNRIGTIDDGNTVMDFDKDEIDRKMSISLAVAAFEWKKNKINIIDTPGYSDFRGEVISALRSTETAVVTIDAVDGIGMMTAYAITTANKLGSSVAVVINKCDRENAHFYDIIDTLNDSFDQNFVPVLLPNGFSEEFSGVVNLFDKKDAEISGELADRVDTYTEKLMEAAAESDEALIEKYFENGELTKDEMVQGLKSGIATNKIVPVFAMSATQNIGVKDIMDLFVHFLPSPKDIPCIAVEKNDETIELDHHTYGKKLGYVIKSLSEQNLGEISIVRMYSGSLTSGDEIELPERKSKDKIGPIYTICGKKRTDADEIGPGDIGGLVKLKNTKTTNSINDKDEHMIVRPFVPPTPVYWKAIKAATQADEDKIGGALNKLVDEDTTIILSYNTETFESVIAGQGETQIGLVKKRLKDRFNVEADLTDPKIPYKETITGKSDVRYRHKKQSGGHGQYGEVYFRVSAREPGSGYEFVNSIVGGAIPSKFIPAVEKGVIETMKEGILAGYPVVDIQVDLYFGTYHDVDSSEMAFKVAARNALRDGFMQAKPILLEPVHAVKIIVPSEFMGDVMGSISSVRGKIQGMNQLGKKQVINAEMPLAELYGYYTSLKSMTQGRGYFTQEFGYYQKLPNDVAQKVIEENKKEE